MKRVFFRFRYVWSSICATHADGYIFTRLIYLKILRREISTAMKTFFFHGNKVRRTGHRWVIREKKMLSLHPYTSRWSKKRLIQKVEINWYFFLKWKKFLCRAKFIYLISLFCWYINMTNKFRSNSVMLKLDWK